MQEKRAVPSEATVEASPGQLICPVAACAEAVGTLSVASAVSSRSPRLVATNVEYSTLDLGRYCCFRG